MAVGLGDAERHLARYLTRNGCVRLPNGDRRDSERSAYKKGYEVRLTLYDEEELREVQEYLRQAGLPVAKHFAKQNQIVQPVYGKTAVEAFLGWQHALADELDATR